MGVKGLWKHLGPAGRKINITDLEGKTIAIDASIWAIQFLSVVQKLHNGGGDQAEDLLESQNEFRVVDGFLRRILKLLFFGIKPVFIFDGQTPALKKKTLQERKKARRNFGGEQSINMQKAAEKLLNKVVTEQLRSTAILTDANVLEETKEADGIKTKKETRIDKDEPDCNDLIIDLKNQSEIDSEININYLSDEGN